MYLQISVWLVCLILGIQSYWDIRDREVPLAVTAAGILLGLVVSMIQKREGIDMLLALGIGVAVLMLGKITNQAIGYGDGALICMMGCFFSAEYLWAILMVAILIAGVTAGVLFVCFHKKKDDTIPFVPFLFLANLVIYGCYEVWI